VPAAPPAASAAAPPPEAAPAAAAPGLRSFLLMWIGQVVSLIGSGLTAFAVGVWTYQTTGNVTLFSLIATSAALPAVLLSPFAGVLVDRFDRRWMLVASDAGAALASLGLLLLFASGRLELWHIYLLVGLGAAFNTLQFPAFGAAVTLLVPKRHFGRASGMMQFGFSGAQVLAPLLAGALLVRTSVPAVIGIDLATFAIAVVLLLFVRIPRPPRRDEARRGMWSQALFGWRYLRERRGLLGLLLYFSFLNLVIPMAMVLTTPLVLSFASAADLGLVLSLGSAGMVAGSVAMTAWGGPRSRMLGILGFAPLASLGMLLAGVRPEVATVAAGLFLTFLVLPVINGSSQALWQAKVAPEVQGRVFATRRMMAQVTAPLAYFLAGPLAERVFVPLLEPGGALAATWIGRLVGVGPGRGIGLLLIAIAAVFAAVSLAAAAWPRLRGLEAAIPDAVPDEPPVPAPAAGA
jgi:MFS transporter, DHA3 family, macrolide efflux protein